MSKMLSDGESVISLDRTLDDIQVIAEEINLNGNGYGFVMDKAGMVVYFCTASHYHKMKSLHYAEELKEYQRTLEDRVLEQTKEIRKQSEEMIRMQEDVIEGMATLIESRDENTGETDIF